jgi:hypothetical protein
VKHRREVDRQVLEDRCKRVPSKYRPLYISAVEGTASPRQAIKAKCQECCGWEDVSTRIGGCTARACPLWPLRPYQETLGASEPAESRPSGTNIAGRNQEATGHSE